jgi:deoxyribodipyrimidine photolyase
MKIIIFNHRRDLRIEDNIGLYKCLNNSNDCIVLPVFFFAKQYQIIQ